MDEDFGGADFGGVADRRVERRVAPDGAGAADAAPPRARAPVAAFKPATAARAPALLPDAVAVTFARALAASNLVGVTAISYSNSASLWDFARQAVAVIAGASTPALRAASDAAHRNEPAGIMVGYVVHQANTALSVLGAAATLAADVRARTMATTSFVVALNALTSLIHINGSAIAVFTNPEGTLPAGTLPAYSPAAGAGIAFAAGAHAWGFGDLVSGLMSAVSPIASVIAPVVKTLGRAVLPAVEQVAGDIVGRDIAKAGAQIANRFLAGGRNQRRHAGPMVAATAGGARHAYGHERYKQRRVDVSAPSVDNIQFADY